MKSLSDLRDFEGIKIYLASNADILDWSFGEVTKPETINYRTFKPEREGLFDERIFGPVKDYECYCGKYKRIRYKGVICDKCGVEVTHSRVRRERMAHIELASPVVHVWFFKGIPSKLALLMDMSPRNLESVIYFSSFIVTHMDGDKKAKAISMVSEHLEKDRTKLIAEMDKEIKKIEQETRADLKDRKDFSKQEAELKVKQSTQKVRTAFEKKIDELEKNYKLTQKKLESVVLHTILSDNEYLNLEEFLIEFTKVEIGANAIMGILDRLDLTALSAYLRKELDDSRGQKALKISKRLKVVEGFRRASIEPSRMVMSVIPVIPPDLRPMVQLEGGRFATSDLNDLYRRVINRNNRLKRLLDLGAPEIIIRNEKRMLQESVDALFDSSKQRKTVRNTRGKKELRSLADMLKGKQGRFRQNLLGKRVDYSGRSVIVNGPTLRLNECGLPKEMALELFKPFVLREILGRGLAPNVKSAKFVLEARGAEVWDILEELVKGHPVMLNRAPTLWRLGIQAFYPKLVEGNSVQLHLCVCPGFNADFDGDQMAVHLPLSKAAIEEARTLMISTENLLKPSDGTPMSIPTKIMLFGLYYMTLEDTALPMWGSVFSSPEEVLYFMESTHSLSLKQKIKVRFNEQILETTPGRLLFNKVIPASLGYINVPVDKSKVNSILEYAFEHEPKDSIANLIDDLKDLGLKYGTISGHSVSLFDIEVPKERESLIDKGRKSIADIDNNYKLGLITKTEASRLSEDTWNQVTAEIDELVWNSLSDTNPVKVLMKSKATRASRDQLKQVGGMKGLIADPTGKVVELPILGNYKLGLSGLEYFVGSRGARKGLVDKGLKTADAGYLTRRLVDVSQEVIVREDDCGTSEGREIEVGERTVLMTFADRVIGRFLAQDVKVGKTVVVKKDSLLTREMVKQIEDAGAKSLLLRSPLTCETSRGVCAKCYGTDLMTKETVRVGVAAGIAAAQSIGEPGTQLTMRTFHTGGVVGKDITQGLPRIEELVEARAPKNLSIMSEITGTVKVTKSGDERKVVVIATDPSEEQQIVEHLVDPVAEIAVKDGQLVGKGEKLTSGHLDLTELLRTVGIKATKRYIISEIQTVYAAQGVAINDKHIEVIVRQMFNNVRIDDPGDTTFLPGEIVTKGTFEEENEKVLAGGGIPSTAKVTLLGITKASLETDSFLAAASFIQTSNVLTDAAASGRVDSLLGLKENVILGRLIPTGEAARLE